jgi:hypothetical protein
VAVFSNLPMKFAAEWTYLQRYPRGVRPETDIKGFDPARPDSEACFANWLATTGCDAVVSVEVAPGSPLHVAVPGCEALAEYGERMRRQQVFRPVLREELAQHGCTVTVWKRPAPLSR